MTLTGCCFGRPLLPPPALTSCGVSDAAASLGASRGHKNSFPGGSRLIYVESGCAIYQSRAETATQS